MLETLIYILACIGPFGILIWSMLNEKTLAEAQRKINRDELDQSLKHQ
jgi:hypothetical protein